jgi:hypothetical protein
MLLSVHEWRPDILQEHVEELESLWNRRLRSARSADAILLGLQRLDRRILAHADALFLAESHALRPLEPLFTPESAEAAAAVAFVVGHADTPILLAPFLEALPEMAPDLHLAVAAALELRAGPALRDALAGLLLHPTLASLALDILTAHADPRATAKVEPLLRGGPAPSRLLAWRVVRRLERASISSDVFRQAVTDADADVRRAVYEAIVITHRRSLLDFLRQVAAAPDLASLEAHLLFAALAGPDDLERVRALAASPALGWERYRILTLCGRASAVDDLLGIMRSGDAVEGALAGVAFRRITGVDVSGPDRIPLVPAGREPDDFSDEIRVCDVSRAEQVWSALRSQMGSARWAAGVDAEVTPPAALAEQVDLETAWAAEMRATFSQPGRPLRFEHERFHE